MADGKQKERIGYDVLINGKKYYGGWYKQVQKKKNLVSVQNVNLLVEI